MSDPDTDLQAVQFEELLPAAPAIMLSHSVPDIRPTFDFLTLFPYAALMLAIPTKAE